MKKLLLLLSCFLTTWCSVQAANPSGSIKSASYNSSNDKIWVTYKTPNAYTASANLYSNQKSAVVNPKHIRLTPSSNYITEGIPVNPEWEEGQYWVYLYVNGYIDGQVSDGHNVFPCFGAKVTITATGSISSIPVTGQSASVSYTMQHGSINSSLRVYKKDSNGTETLVKRINLSEPNTNINTYKSVSLGIYENGNYICKLYSNEKVLATKSFEVSNWYSGVKITPMGSGTLKLDFTLKDTGVDVAFRVTAASLTNYTGETNTYYYGRCDQHEGTYTVSVPRYTGQVIYAVELLVNGQSVNGASIQVYNR